MAVRRLYTNFEEAVFRAQCPIVINGIEEIGTRGDLLDRLIPITLPTIPDTERVTEKEVEAEFLNEAPMIMGALFDAVATALSRIDQIDLASHGRMADFYELAVAAAPGIGFTEGEVLETLDRVRARTTAVALEGSVLAGPLQELLLDHRGVFVGNATKLQTALERYLPPTDPLPRGWPSGPRPLADQLRRLAPDLRRSGITITPIANGRKWRISKVEGD